MVVVHPDHVDHHPDHVDHPDRVDRVDRVDRFVEVHACPGAGVDPAFWEGVGSWDEAGSSASLVAAVVGVGHVGAYS